jgi:hypothetical protein
MKSSYSRARIITPVGVYSCLNQHWCTIYVGYLYINISEIAKFVSDKLENEGFNIVKRGG